jgi:hypothetical protein
MSITEDHAGGWSDDPRVAYPSQISQYSFDEVEVWVSCLLISLGFESGTTPRPVISSEVYGLNLRWRNTIAFERRRRY